MDKPIVNRVANSGIITLDLEDFYPQGERVFVDIKEQLWQGLALKEKDFRAFIKETDWSKFEGQCVAIQCSVDALIPTWAYILLTTALMPHAKRVVFGDLEALETALFEEAIQKINPEDYLDKRVVIKGCSNKAVPMNAYVSLAALLHGKAKAIMYGEPCSTVPIWKKPRQA